MNASELILPAVGQPFAGGFFGGRFFLGAQPSAIIFAPADEGEFEIAQYHNKRKDSLEGATSYIDGLANTRAMAAAGSTLAQEILSLRIDGLDDWHLPARLPALVLYHEIIQSPEFSADMKHGFARSWYWTSTRHAEDNEYAWGQSFTSGHQLNIVLSHRLRARAVRTIAI